MQTPATPHGTHHGARHEDTILLIGHGSREPEGNDEIHRFVAQWRTRQPGWNIEVCFIEFAPPACTTACCTPHATPAACWCCRSS